MHRPCLSAVAAMVLLALGPLSGLGGRAHAGFVGTAGDGAEGNEAPRWKVLVLGFLQDADIPAHPRSAESSGSSTPEETPRPAPPAPTRAPRDLASPDGAGATGAAPAGSSGPSTLMLNLSGRLALPQPTLAGLLFLADSPYRPQPPASRLFRPPRS